MRFFIASLFISISALIAVGVYLDLPYWLKPSQERLSIVWSKDFKKLSQQKDFDEIFSKIQKINVSSPDARVAEWVDNVGIPIKTNKEGSYFLQIIVLQWIEGYRHGVVVQYEVFDTASKNKVFELGRTFHVGYIW